MADPRLAVDPLPLVPEGAREAWRALCVALEKLGPAPCEADPERWWSRSARHYAAASCRRCPVLLECGLYALAAGEREGVWGGLTEAERRRGGRGG